jgi:hypothetical protein
MGLQEVGRGYKDWIDLDQDRGNVAGTCDCGNEISGSIKWGNFLTSQKPVSFSRTVLHGVSKLSK